MRNLVEPIRSKKELNMIKSYLYYKNKKIYVIFMVGISTALRISDILQLKKNDLVTNNGNIKKEIRLKEKKTNKIKKFPITSNLENALKEYFEEEELTLNDYVFLNRRTNKPITRQYVSKVFIQVKDELKLGYNFNTHSMRKTWGYWAYKSNYDIMLIMDALNHSSTFMTKKYIGIRQEDINNMYISLNL